MTTASASVPSTPAALPGADREQLILEHMPQVRLIARKIHDRIPGIIALEDLVSAGTLGLIAAIDRYDTSQGVKLRTYAEFKIRGAILDSLRELDWAPRTQRQRARKLLAAAAEAESRLGTTAGVEDIAQEIGITLQECQSWMRDTWSLSMEALDRAVSDTEGGVIERQVAAESAESCPSQKVESSDLRRVLADAIAKMPKQERVVLSLVFHEGLTLREIAKVLELHESRVSQIKTRALARMRTIVEVTWPRKGAARPQ